jgi:hypothetical protein
VGRNRLAGRFTEEKLAEIGFNVAHVSYQIKYKEGFPNWKDR